MADYLYLNNNPRGTTCPECRRRIGRVYSLAERPTLPRHQGCYCYYQEIEDPRPPADPDPIAGVGTPPLDIARIVLPARLPATPPPTQAELLPGPTPLADPAAAIAPDVGDFSW